MHSRLARHVNHRSIAIPVVVLGLLILLVILGPLLWPNDATQIDLSARNMPPSLNHPAGTDELGRDLFAALIKGGRLSLSVGFAAMILSTALGTLIGLMSGAFKSLDGVLMRVTDLFLALPLLPLLLVAIMLWRDTLRQTFGTETGVLILLITLISLTSWMHTARVVRTETIALSKRDFLLAAKALGASGSHLIRRHFLPNLVRPVFVSAVVCLANAVLAESALSFLGMGLTSDTPSWGRLLHDGTQYFALSPWRVIAPGLAISITMLCANYLAEGLSTALDPHR